MISEVSTLSCVVLVPVFNDWSSIRHLLSDLDLAFDQATIGAEVYLIDDGSTIPFPDDFICQQFSSISRISILTLGQNVGHQKAIAAGIAFLSKRVTDRSVIVMDGDGEDDPALVPKIVNAIQCGPSGYVVVRRTTRNEGIIFKTLYWCYKLTFLMLTGQRLEYGNFCGFFGTQLPLLAADTDVPLHLASRILRLRATKTFFDHPKTQRYDGESQMNYTSLITHALASFSVYADLVTIRIFVFWVFLAAISILGILGVIGTRMFTDLAIPGWATGAAGTLINLVVLALTLCINSAVLIISARSAQRMDGRHILSNLYPKEIVVYE